MINFHRETSKISPNVRSTCGNIFEDVLNIVVGLPLRYQRSLSVKTIFSELILKHLFKTMIDFPRETLAISEDIRSTHGDT
jgi:hypothetical protein